MFKKGLLVLLALFMLVFLFAGCTSKNGGDTSLEGTWRVTEQCWVDEEDGEIVDEGSETYPAEDEEEDCLIQPYFQLKNNVFKSFSKHIYEEGSIVFLFGEGTYEVEGNTRSEEHTSELQSRPHLVCRLLLEKKKNKKTT